MLLPEVAELVRKGLGLRCEGVVRGRRDGRRSLHAALLVAEMRSDLSGPEPVALSQIPRPDTEGPGCAGPRRSARGCGATNRPRTPSLPMRWRANSVWPRFDIDAEALGRIDTFRFEERRLLEACDRLLAEGEAERVLEIVNERAGSYWVSVSEHPDRHAAWQACGELAELSLGIDTAEKGSQSRARQRTRVGRGLHGDGGMASRRSTVSGGASSAWTSA